MGSISSFNCCDAELITGPQSSLSHRPLIKNTDKQFVSFKQYCYCNNALLHGFLREEEKLHDLSYPIPKGIYGICSKYYKEICSYTSDVHKPEWMQVEHTQFYLDLAEFLSALPIHGREHIWKHSIRIWTRANMFDILQEANQLHHIEELLSTEIIVYHKVEIPKISKYA